jgi:ABC-2 type transport system ATP-binding protein
VKAITVDRLRRTFGAFVAVDDVSFEVEQGEIFGFLGANGAGKSTTIRMLVGALPPTSGDATVAGFSVSRDPRSVKRRIGYVSQRFSLYPDLTVRQNLSFFGGAYGEWGSALDARIDEIVQAVELEGRLDTLTGELPGGIRQRVALGAALLHRPPIVFLDEPTAGVDPHSRRRFWDLIRTLAAEGTTVLVTTHHMDEAEHCGRVGLMVDGKLVALDTPDGLARTWVPGRMFRVEGRAAHLATAPLRGRSDVVEVEPFGAALHVRTAEEIDAAKVQGWLTEGGLAGRVSEIRPSLEDVFLAVAGRDQP